MGVIVDVVGVVVDDVVDVVVDGNVGGVVGDCVDADVDANVNRSEFSLYDWWKILKTKKSLSHYNPSIFYFFKDK